MENCSYCNNRNKCGCGIDLVIVPANLGDDKGIYAPKNGKYQDTVVKYEANGHTYLYAHDGTYDMICSSSTVTTVNGKTGDVRLNAEDVGALPSGTFIPTSTSQLVNDSGFITEGDIPSKTSQLVNDSGFVSDANYVHTDNNFTTAEKNKLGAMPAITGVVDNLTSTSATNPLSANQGKVLNDKFGDYYTSAQTDSAISTAVSGKATTAQAIGTTESYTIASASWSALSSSGPYTYSATVTATTTLGADTIVHLLNDQPVAFANYGFAVAGVSGQTVTIYSIEQPTGSVTLKINYKEGA